MLLCRRTSRRPTIGWDAMSTLRRRIRLAAALATRLSVASPGQSRVPTQPATLPQPAVPRARPGDGRAKMLGNLTTRTAGSSAGGLGGHLLLIGIVLVIVPVIAIGAVAYRRARQPRPPP